MIHAPPGLEVYVQARSQAKFPLPSGFFFVILMVTPFAGHPPARRSRGPTGVPSAVGCRDLFGLYRGIAPLRRNVREIHPSGKWWSELLKQR